ncbi:isochorismatase [Chloroflexota bacterium]
MSFPTFYNPDTVGTLYAPQTMSAISAGQAAGIKPASEDTARVILLLVDTQVDFIHEDGALAVPGAIADTRRTIEWIYRNINQITAIAASLDSHTPLQIFYPTWWVDAYGQHPDPYTAISSADVQSGRWIPVRERHWSMDYVHKLESEAKKTLMIWPYHTMIGTPGQAITPALYEAIAYHAGARSSQPEFLTKGQIAKTEHYSIMEPEVKILDHPQGGLNNDFLNMLATFDLIYIAGQAKSHCVLETAASMVRHFADSPDIINKLRFMMDCTSSVFHPDIDFDAIANDAIAKFEAQGMKLVNSAEPIA